MSDTDILRHVLEVEHEAATIEAEARDEAARRLRAVRAELASKREAALAARSAELAAELRAALDEARRTQAAELVDWRASLEAAPRNSARFEALVRRLVEGS
jgi:hypothetical protein